MSASSEPRIYDNFFDAETSLILMPFESPGYHSRVPQGTPVHPTHPSLCYALDLLLREDASSDGRACAILRRVLPLQDRDPLSPTYGVWPWLAEEPLAQMAPPDWNWADFCGFRLAQILLRAGDRLPEELAGEVRLGLFHAAGCIYRRNVGTHYTNICVMGGIVATLAGEILEEDRLVTYGRERLLRVVARHREEGSFNEYNSPTYTRVVLWDCEQALACLRDQQAREAAEYLFRSAWEIVARHFHPATGQWAGPHSRDYTPFLVQEMARYIAFKTSVDIRGNPGSPFASRVSPLTGWAVERSRFPSPVREFYSAIHFAPDGLPCPPDLVERFRSLPQPEFSFRECFSRNEDERASRWGATWMHEQACLGSVNHDFFMDQRRAVLGFWNGSDGCPVALRLRFLHDGREFASAYVWNAQDRGRVLSGVHLLLGQGDFHPQLDIPSNNTFTASDFRVRYELRGAEVAVRREDGVFILASGEWEAAVLPLDGCFGSAPVSWELQEGDGWVAMDGVFYSGGKQDFAFAELEQAWAVSALELRPANTRGRTEEFTCRRDPVTQHVAASWGNLAIHLPDHAVPRVY